MTNFNLQDFSIVPGGFADILIDSNQSRAFKIFRSYDHPALEGTGKEDIGAEETNQYRRKVFESELEAYNLAQKSEVLLKHTPTFYGQVNFDNVFMGQQNVTNHYLKGCCFEMEYVPGICVKLENLKYNDQLIQHLEQSLKFDLKTILSEFYKLDIAYVYDSSVIYNSQTFVVIDFATKDSFEFAPIIGMD